MPPVRGELAKLVAADVEVSRGQRYRFRLPGQPRTRRIDDPRLERMQSVRRARRLVEAAAVRKPLRSLEHEVPGVAEFEQSSGVDFEELPVSVATGTAIDGKPQDRPVPRRFKPRDARRVVDGEQFAKPLRTEDDPAMSFHGIGHQESVGVAVPAMHEPPAPAIAHGRHHAARPPARAVQSAKDMVELRAVAKQPTCELVLSALPGEHLRGLFLEPIVVVGPFDAPDRLPDRLLSGGRVSKSGLIRLLGGQLGIQGPGRAGNAGPAQDEATVPQKPPPVHGSRRIHRFTGRSTPRASPPRS